MCKLVLNVGDTVRNINPRSCRKGWVGKVVDSSGQFDNCYHITYLNGEEQAYNKGMAHKYIEKVVSEDRQFMKCLSLGLRYGVGPIAEAEKLWAELLARTPGGRIEVVHDEIRIVEPKRRVLKKVRRNVITGKTQEDYVRDLGYAKGVQQFNTRALGKSTGQALHAIGSAMTNPGTEIRISHIDHAKESPLCSTPWTTLDKHFRALVQSLIGNMKGFTFTDTHIVFNPIVTEEIYVEL